MVALDESHDTIQIKPEWGSPHSLLATAVLGRTVLCCTHMPAPPTPHPAAAPPPGGGAGRCAWLVDKKPQSSVAAQLISSWHIQRNYVRQHGRCYKRYNITSPIPHPSRMPLCRISGSAQRGSAHGTQHGDKPSHGYSDHRRGSVIFTRSSDFVRA